MKPGDVPSWTTLKPLFESMFFDLGPNEIERMTGLGMGTIYDLLHGRTDRPRVRTRRDIHFALLEWNPAIYGTERSGR